MNNHKNGGIVFGALVAGLLIGSAGPAQADSGLVASLVGP